MTRGFLVLGLLVLAGCGDPLKNVDRLDDVALAAPVEGDAAAPRVAASAEEVSRRPGLLGLLRNAPEDAPQTAATEVDEVVAAVSAEDAPALAGTQTAALEAPLVTLPDPIVAEPAKRRGFLSRLRSPNKTDATPRPTPVSAPVAETPVVTAAVAPTVAPPEPAPKRQRKGLFGGNRAAKIDPNAVDAQVVPYGVSVPYGQIARVCDVPKARLGKETDRYPARSPVYRLYDSKPKQTGLRTYYITGFKDGCARQFTAALALFGDPQLHEQLRYGLPSKVQPYSKTDAAYEVVKSKVCKTPKSKPCGDRMDKLAKDTVFVSTYERYVGSSKWANILLHKGQVVEKDGHAR